MKPLLRRVLVASLTLLGSSLFASLPPTFTAKELSQGYSDTGVLARPLDEVGETSATSAESREGLTVRQRFPRIGNLRVVEVPSGETVKDTIKRLRATGRYAYVEPDRILRKFATPSDSYFSQQWSLKNNTVSGADISATTAWDTITDASSVIVAVVDSGALLTHSDLTSNLWSTTSGGSTVYGISAIGGSGSITNYNPTDTEVGHGTHVSGIIGAVGNNSLGIAGVAWTAKLMELRYLHGSEGSGTTSDSICCLNYAITNGAKIVNASYGSSSYSSAEYEALKKCRDAGIIVVAAAGNDGTDNDLTPDYPAAHALDNIVAVACTNKSDALSSFSNYGAGSVDLAAPGESIYSTWIPTLSPYTSYTTESGTSMSAPHVTGALALLRAKYPSETYRQIINRVLRSTTKLSVLSGVVQTGGRLNLASAIASTSNAPFNDDFSSTAALSGANVRVRASNVGASAETNEPAHAGSTATHSLWWTWTATETTTLTITTTGSKVAVSGGTDTTLDTVLAVYTGSSVGALTAVASNDDYTSTNGSTVTTSRVDVAVTAGTTYHIAVDGKNGATGYIALNIGAIPGNDNFAAATTLSGVGIRQSGTTLNASRESGEPDPTAAGAGQSVWYKWTAPSSGHFSLAIFATTTDTVAAVYTGSSVSSLTTVASNDNNANSSNTDALVSFTATAGTTYYLQVDHSSDSDVGGAFILTLTDSLWEYPAYDDITGPPAVASDGTVYFGAGTIDNDSATDTYIYALNADGSRKWRYLTSSSSAGIVNASPAIGSDGTIYIGDSTGKLFALRSTGTLKWSYTTDGAITSSAALGSDGTIYIRSATTLYALTDNGSTVTKKWTYTLNTSTYSSYASPAIGSDGTIYIGTADSTTTGILYALTDSGTSATKKWSYTTDGQIYTSPAIADDGTLYLGTLAGYFYALTPGTSSATKKWSITLAAYNSADNSITSSPVLAADGTIYFAAYDHLLYALNPSTGATKWTVTLGDEVRACSPAVASDGTVFIGAYDGIVYAYNSSGTFLRNYPAAKRVRSSPVIANNRLYFGSLDAKLHAFNLGQGNLASAWPMFHRDSLRTGRYATGSITLSAQSSSRSVTTGSAVTLSVTATSSATLSYQWYKDGTAISGATSSTYTISSATSSDSASYTVVVSTTAGSVTSSTIVLNVLASGTLPSVLSNIATRAYCSTGNNVTIGGFVISGSASKSVLIRAVGPSLTSQSLSSSEVLADPTLTVYNATTGNAVGSNDNWTTNANAAAITSTASSLGAAALLSTDTTSAALLTTLAPGVYTFVVTGNNSTSGIVLLEVYDADGSGPVSKFSNIATRAYAKTGNNVAIGGFVIAGTPSKTVLIRAVGPSLPVMTANAITSSEVLADPVIQLYSTSGLIGTLDNWTDNSSTVTTTGAAVGATALDSSDTKSAALVTTLAPGAYTFIVQGQSSTSGIVLIEVYDAD